MPRPMEEGVRPASPMVETAAKAPVVVANTDGANQKSKLSFLYYMLL